MAQEYEKRFYTLDGKTRITIYREEYPESPRDMTDEPFHCEDWSRDRSIMNKKEEESCSSSPRKLLEYMISHYGDHRKIIDTLINEGKKKDAGTELNDILIYNRSERGWSLMSYATHYDYESRKNKCSWYQEYLFEEKRECLSVDDMLDLLCDSTIEYIIEHCMTDKVKLASYGFGYYGGISFDNEVSCESEGICWLEKDEFLKYAGGDNSEWVKKEEQVWKEKSLTEIEWLCDELDAWSNGYVYGYQIEHKHVVKVTEQHEDGTIKEYERIDWDDDFGDSCWGFYGDLWKEENLNYILESAGLKKEELTEEAA